MGWRVGVDTGGTFTDVCLYDEETDEIVVTKVSSTPEDPGEAIIAGVIDLVSRYARTPEHEQTSLSAVSYFAHGTTVATNALLQERGVRTGLITTDGFGDLLELGRGRRPRLYDFTARNPEPLVSRDLRVELSERIGYDGSTKLSLDPDEVRAAVRTLKDAGVEAVAVCFLYSYLAPAHEELVRAIVEEEFPQAFLSVSHEVLPEFREFERLSTTVVNAYVGPTIGEYMARLRQRLGDAGLPVSPKVTQSSGAIMSLTMAEELPVRTLLSGPSAGVVGAAHLCEQAGFADIITFDMGGTSSDVALVNGGRPVAAQGMVLDGRPVQAPMLDINTVGAGGGSIAWIDNGGHLKVGPQSAGAVPGPACYGQGNIEPTVTDANVVLGVLNQESLLGGSMPIDASLSFVAIEGLGQRLGMSTTATAQGIISVATANMARAIRVISVQRGYDPTQYALVAFGGAGPLHAGRLAEELGMSRVIIPQRPGAMSAAGMLMTDLRSDCTRTAITDLGLEYADTFDVTFAELEQEASAWAAAEAADQGSEVEHVLSRVLDLRYRGQNYELPIDAPTGTIDNAWFGEVMNRFHAAHQQRYGYSTPGAPIAAVTFRVAATITVRRAQFPIGRPAEAGDEPAPAGTRRVFSPEEGDYVECAYYERDSLRAGHVILGPAVIEQYDATALVLPGHRATVHESQVIVTELDHTPDTSLAHTASLKEEVHA